jgi:hypothetical protein
VGVIFPGQSDAPGGNKLTCGADLPQLRYLGQTPIKVKAPLVPKTCKQIQHKSVYPRSTNLQDLLFWATKSWLLLMPFSFNSLLSNAPYSCKSTFILPSWIPKWFFHPPNSQRSSMMISLRTKHILPPLHARFGTTLDVETFLLLIPSVLVQDKIFTTGARTKTERWADCPGNASLVP